MVELAPPALLVVDEADELLVEPDGPSPGMPPLPEVVGLDMVPESPLAVFGSPPPVTVAPGLAAAPPTEVDTPWVTAPPVVLVPAAPVRVATLAVC